MSANVEQLVAAVPRLRANYDRLLSWWQPGPEPSRRAVLTYVVAPGLLQSARDGRAGEVRLIFGWLEKTVEGNRRPGLDEGWDVVLWQLETNLTDEEYQRAYDAAGPRVQSLMVDLRGGSGERRRRPVIKSYPDLTIADFEESPIWICCHTADADEPWYDETVEDDYRPYDGRLPLDSDNLYVVKAEATLSDGTLLVALLDLYSTVPASSEHVTADVFAPDGRRVSLAPASMGLDENVRRQDVASLGRAEEAIFPVKVVAEYPWLPIVTVVDWFTQRVEWPDGLS